jgi:hypothetical protein
MKLKRGIDKLVRARKVANMNNSEINKTWGWSMPKIKNNQWETQPRKKGNRNTGISKNLKTLNINRQLSNQRHRLIGSKNKTQ